MNDSAIARVANLKSGETYSQSRYFSASDGPISMDAVREARRQLMHTLSSIISRVRDKNPDMELKQHTTYSFTRDLDIVVTGVIVRDDDI